VNRSGTRRYRCTPENNPLRRTQPARMGVHRGLAVFFNPFCPLSTAKVLTLKATVFLPSICRRSVPRKPQPPEPWELAYVGDNNLLRYCKTISFFIAVLFNTSAFASELPYRPKAF